MMKIKFDSEITDYAQIFAQALLYANENETIELEKGVYRVKGEHADRAFYSLSNNDAYEKAMAFYIKNKRNIKIKGNGATILLSDFISGFGIVESENIEISDLIIDYDGNYHFELEVEEVLDGIAKVKKREGFDFSIRNGEIFTACGKIGKSLCTLFDKSTNKPYYRQASCFFDFSAQEPRENRYKQVRLFEEEGEFYIQSEYVNSLREGAVLVVCYMGKRFNQAIFITDCKNVLLKNVRIDYSPSMGVVAQLTENITLDNVSVEARGKHGMLSSICDSTHFVHCSGEVRIKDCRFFNMMDDAVNIHGNYSVVDDIRSDTITLRIMHMQQRGVCAFKVGDKITVYRQKTADMRCILAVKEAVTIDDNCIKLRVDGETDSVETGDIVYNSDRMPNIEITDTACGNNRPRGFLLNSPKKTTVRNCYFSNSEHGIELAGDTNYWFEAGCCTDVTVENCIFENCNHAEGDYAIAIRPIFDTAGEEKYYHKNVTIRNNTFCGFQNGMLSARNVEKLSVYNNRFIRNDLYPARSLMNGKIFLKDCAVNRIYGNVDMEEILPLLAPIWEGDKVYEQTAVFVGEKDVAPLLFNPVGKVTVTDFSKRIVYEEGKDFRVTERGVERLNGNIPFYTETEFYRTTPDVINVGVNPEKMSFADGKDRYFKFGGIHEKTVRISYSCVEKTDLFGLSEKRGCCPKFKEKLKAKEKAKILFYGDSITEGANASAELRVAPYQDAWTRLAHTFLSYYYQTDIAYVNTAVGGKDSVWGLENFDERVIAHQPDLLILAFGMNDGGKSVEEYGSLIDAMLKKFREELPQSEVLLTATSVPNPQSRWYGNQVRFLGAIIELSEKYHLPLLDMTTLTEKLYGDDGYVRYRDFTGNNVNHPNDFGVRLYAQAFLNEIMGEEYRAYFRK